MIYVDGALSNEGHVSIMDRGYLVGDGLFETMRAHDGVVRGRAEHIARMRHGIEVLGYPDVISDFEAALDALVEAGPADAYLRIQISAGPMADIPGESLQPEVTGFVKPLTTPAPEDYARGVRLRTTAYRIDEQSPLAGIKTLSFLPYIAARRAASPDDALLWNTQGRPVEASTSNLFVVKDDTVYAPGPSEGAVDGVTRRFLLTHLDHVEAICDIDIHSADEVFISNTTRGPMPVTHIDGRPVGDGTRPVWQRLHDAHEAWT